MADHQYITHSSCDAIYYCEICHGGTLVCGVCGLSDRCRTTECPGKIVTFDMIERIYHGQIDFVNGRWEPNAISKHCPPYHAYKQEQLVNEE